MKRSLILILIVLSAGLLAYLLVPETPVRVVLISSSTPGVAERDQQMTQGIRRFLDLRAQEQGIAFEITELDAAQPQAELEAAFAALVAGSAPDLLVGCGDSTCVRRILPELEKNGLLLLYPGSSEGLMRSRNLIHLGAVANQFLFPAMSWIRQNLGDRILYMGSESARSRLMERLITRQLLTNGSGGLVSSEYLGTLELLPSIMDRINVYHPDVVLFDACEWLPMPEVRQALRNLRQKVFSLCIDQRIPDLDLYFVSHYFDHQHNRENVNLQKVLQIPLNGLIVQATVAVDLFLDARKEGKTGGAHEFSDFLSGRNAHTAAGTMAVDFDNQGVWHSVFIARNMNEGEHLLWMSDSLIRPVMFPGLEAPSDWQHHLTIYWRDNGGRWRQGTIEGRGWL